MQTPGADLWRGRYPGGRFAHLRLCKTYWDHPRVLDFWDPGSSAVSGAFSDVRCIQKCSGRSATFRSFLRFPGRFCVSVEIAEAMRVLPRAAAASPRRRTSLWPPRNCSHAIRVGSAAYVSYIFSARRRKGADAAVSVRWQMSRVTCLRRPKGLNPSGLPTSLTRVMLVRGGEWME